MESISSIFLLNDDDIDVDDLHSHHPFLAFPPPPSFCIPNPLLSFYSEKNRPHIVISQTGNMKLQKD